MNSVVNISPTRPTPRIDWGRAWRAIQALRVENENVEHAFEVMIALDGGQMEALFQRFLAEPGTPDLLAERPSLLRTLADFDALRPLPDGSFGRAYLSLMEREGYAPDALRKASQLAAGLEELLPGPERQWFIERNGGMHDLLHVLTGYPQDWAGETALLAFDHGRDPMRARRVGLLGTLLGVPVRPWFYVHRYMHRAWRRGRRSRIPLAYRWEQALARPLEDVRRELHIEPVTVAHPKGVLTGDLHATRWTCGPACV